MTSVGFKKIVFSLLLSGVVCFAHAQFRTASVGINGLTCSQCSRSVEMQLRKLAFVKDVKMNLEQTEGTLIFKERAKVNIADIAAAVKDAGFSVRFLKAVINSDQVTLSDKKCFSLDGNGYQLLNAASRPSAGFITLQFVGKGYLPGSALKQYTLPATTVCKGKKTYYAVVE